MIRSRRFALAAAALLVGLSACGDTNQRTSGPQPPAVIQLGSAEGGNVAESAAADRMMMPWQDITYVFDGAATDLGSSGPAWTVPVGVQPDVDRIAKIAAVLGVQGEVRKLSADEGGGWMVGAADYTTATLTVSTDGMLSWWFNPSPSPMSVEPCFYPAIASEPVGVVPVEAGGNDAVGTETTVVEVIASNDQPLPECVEPAPPANVPDEAAARQAAEQLFAEMGYDSGGDEYEYEVYADEWGANVTAFLVLGGHRSPVTMSVGFGADGAVTWASGSLAAPQQADDYPLVSVSDAVLRLNDDTGRWSGYWGGATVMSRSVGSDISYSERAAAPAATDAAAPEPSTGPTEPVTIEPVCDLSTDCAIDPMPPLEPITVHLTGVVLDLTMVWAADNTIWLLPAYTFSSDDEGQYTVIAVDDSFLAMPEPEPMPVESMPVESLPVESLPVDSTEVVEGTSPVAIVCPPVPTDITTPGLSESIADTIVGLCTDGAAALIAGLYPDGEMRVARENGIDLAVTADYRENRVNVAVEAGIVTEVLSIG